MFDLFYYVKKVWLCNGNKYDVISTQLKKTYQEPRMSYSSNFNAGNGRTIEISL